MQINEARGVPSTLIPRTFHPWREDSMGILNRGRAGSCAEFVGLETYRRRCGQLTTLHACQEEQLKLSNSNQYLFLNVQLKLRKGLISRQQHLYGPTDYGTWGEMVLTTDSSSRALLAFCRGCFSNSSPTCCRAATLAGAIAWTLARSLPLKSKNPRLVRLQRRNHHEKGHDLKVWSKLLNFERFESCRHAGMYVSDESCT